MSDDEMEKNWKPSGRRPQSTMAKSFSAALDDMFKMDNSIADLDAAVAEKKHAVVSQATELEALEARLRETEERLKANGLAVPQRSPSQKIRLEALLAQEIEVTSKQSVQPNKQASRPTTATRPGTGKSREDSYTNPPMPGGLPPTPGASEGEYFEVLTRESSMSADYIILNQDGREIDEEESTTAHQQTT